MRVAAAVHGGEKCAGQNASTENRVLCRICKAQKNARVFAASAFYAEIMGTVCAVVLSSSIRLFGKYRFYSVVRSECDDRVRVRVYIEQSFLVLVGGLWPFLARLQDEAWGPAEEGNASNCPPSKTGHAMCLANAIDQTGNGRAESSANAGR
jgi:hypothetical protein